MKAEIILLLIQILCTTYLLVGLFSIIMLCCSTNAGLFWCSCGIHISSLCIYSSENNDERKIPKGNWINYNVFASLVKLGSLIPGSIRHSTKKCVLTEISIRKIALPGNSWRNQLALTVTSPSCHFWPATCAEKLIVSSAVALCILYGVARWFKWSRLWESTRDHLTDDISVGRTLSYIPQIQHIEKEVTPEGLSQYNSTPSFRTGR